MDLTTHPLTNWGVVESAGRLTDSKPDARQIKVATKALTASSSHRAIICVTIFLYLCTHILMLRLLWYYNMFNGLGSGLWHLNPETLTFCVYSVNSNVVLIVMLLYVLLLYGCSGMPLDCYFAILLYRYITVLFLCFFNVRLTLTL